MPIAYYGPTRMCPSQEHLNKEHWKTSLWRPFIVWVGSVKELKFGLYKVPIINPLEADILWILLN